MPLCLGSGKNKSLQSQVNHHELVSLKPTKTKVLVDVTVNHHKWLKHIWIQAKTCPEVSDINCTSKNYKAGCYLARNIIAVSHFIHYNTGEPHCQLI